MTATTGTATKLLPIQSEDAWGCLAQTRDHICCRNAGHAGKHMDAEWDRDAYGWTGRGRVIAEWSGGVCRTCGGQGEIQPDPSTFSGFPEGKGPACADCSAEQAPTLAA